jgi:hypothetical protein
MTDKIELYRKALGLSDSATPHEVAETYMERKNQMRAGSTPTPTAPEPMSPAVLAEQEALTTLFKQMTEPSADGLSFDEMNAIEQMSAKYPKAFEEYRRLNLQSG